jgi:hypothetical protein
VTAHHTGDAIATNGGVANTGIVYGGITVGQTDAARLRRDVERLRDITTANRASPPSSLTIGTPEGRVSIQRAVAGMLGNYSGSLALTGDPGCGKSVLLHHLAGIAEADVVYLTHQQLRGTAGQTRTELNLDHDLAEVLIGWPGSRPGLLLLDGLDQTRGTDASTWLPQLSDRLRGSRWSVIGSIRLFDLRHGSSWRTMFAGAPVDAEHADPGLGQVAHLLVGDLSPDELATVHAASPSLQTVTHHAGHRLRALLTNPFNLSLVGDLLTAGLDVSRIRSRLDLLARYWNLRVTGTSDGRIRARVLKILVTAMVAQRSQESDDEPLTDAGMLPALDDLLRDGVLRELRAAPWATHRPIGFAHPVLFDYAVALNALGDLRASDSLLGVLDTDPDLVMTVRPSLDYRLAIVWHDDPSRTGFWRLALRLSEPKYGHMLAAAAAASVAARELSDPSDLAPLETACLHPETTARWSSEDAYTLAFLLAAGLNTSGSPGALDAFGHLLQTLAQAAGDRDDTSLALLVAQLGPRATKDKQPARGTPAAQGLVRAAVAAMNVALAGVSDPRRIRVAQSAAMALTSAAALDARATSEVIRGVISAPALHAWGVQAVRGPIMALAPITPQDPELAYELATSLWRLPVGETSSNVLGSQILRLTMNSRDELHSVRYLVGEAFPEVVAADLLAAARIFTTIAEQQADYAGVVPNTPRPHVRSGGSLDPFSDDVLFAMAEALLVGLESDARSLEAAIKILIVALVRAEAWRLILHRAATSTSPALARALTAALTAPALFANRQTWSLAVSVVARVAPQFGDTERQAVRDAIITATEPNIPVSEPRLVQLRERRSLLLGALDGRDPYVPPPRTSADGLDDGWSGEIIADEADDLIRSVDTALESREPAEEHLAMLLELWPALLARHTADTESGQVHGRLIRAAGPLAAAPEARPDTVVGHQILTAVEALLPLPATPGLPRAAYGEAPCDANVVTEAVATVVKLLQHPVWQEQHGHELRARLRAQLDSSKTIDRTISINALHLIFPDADERLTRIEERLATEQAGQVVIAWLHALARLGRTHPQQTDQVLHHVTGLRPSMYLPVPSQDRSEIHDSPAASLVQILTHLAVRRRTSFADRTVRSWLASPSGHSAAVTLAAEQLRSSLNSADPARHDEQQTTFELYALAAAHVRREWTDPGTAQSALIVADSLATNLYHASGAFTAGQPRPLGDPMFFATLALPVLTDLAHVHHPAVTHHIVQTAEHLSRVACKDALLLTQQAVTGDPGYIIESLGLDAALDMINRCVADHRDLVLGDPECATAVRTVLEQFVRAGWPRAIDTAENLDQLFR